MFDACEKSDNVFSDAAQNQARYYLKNAINISGIRFNFTMYDLFINKHLFITSFLFLENISAFHEQVYLYHVCR